MSLVNDTIKLAGHPMTIIRAAGNIASYFWKGTMQRRGLEPKSSYERFYLIPSDSGIVAGDLIQHGLIYYLVMSLSLEGEFAEPLCLQGTLYLCNSLVAVRQYNSGSKAFIDSATNVRALIIVEGWTGENDRNVAVQASRISNRSYTVYAQKVAGIGKASMIVDQDSRRFRVSDDINPVLAGGITTARMMIENA